MTREIWEDWRSRLHVQEGDLSMPRFELEWATTLNDVLIATATGALRAYHACATALQRELGIEPVTRSALYGLGPLPVLRVEISDAARLVMPVHERTVLDPAAITAMAGVVEAA